MKQRFYQYALLMRLHRPIGIFLLLWPTLWALWVAGEGKPDLLVLGVFVAGVVLMRSAGCVINDIADRHIDRHVSRTHDRPITAGRVSVREALVLFAVLCLAAFALVLLLNRLTVYLSFAAVALAAVYPFMKRITHLPQVVLGAAFAMAIPMAFAAQTGEVPPVAWLLYVTTIVWTVAYDTMYAMADREEDLRIGVKSTAILFGDADRVIIGILQALFLAGLYLFGKQAELGWVFNLGIIAATVYSLYQQYLIRDRDPARCFEAFLNNNWLGAAVFAGIVLEYLSAY
ncbi:MAG TPA: 4-hydroxybenzoate octaprenyltransferase [Gammaproteobacteria bacterium]|nr:4-hydroxybenzoate octaprenyltransferase [Gammaproteobacteria bacterium]